MVRRRSLTSRVLSASVVSLVLFFLGAPGPHAQLRFEVMTSSSLAAPGLGSAIVCYGEFDGDGGLDGVAINRSDGQVFYVESFGEGRFRVADLVFDEFPYRAIAATPGDFDGDGNLDVAVTRFKNFTGREGRLTVFLGDGAGGFSVFQHLPIQDDPGKVVATDLDGDGWLELIVGTDVDGGQMTLLDGNGATFSVTDTVTLPDNVNASEIVLGELDGDGRIDVVVSNEVNRSAVYVARDAGLLLQNRVPMQEGVRSPLLMDGDGDGMLDLVYLAGESLLIRPGNGQGRFLSSRVLLALDGAGRCLQTGDLNGDGRADLVATTEREDVRRDGHRAEVFVGQEAGSYRSSQVFFVPDHPGLLLEDVNGDGATDLLVPGVHVALNDGEGRLQVHAQRYMPRGPGSFAVHDLDEDGHLDLLFPGGSVLTVLFGEGDERFSVPRFILLHNTFHEVCFGDVNRDGHLDIVAARNPTGGFDDVHVLLGDGQGGFVPFSVASSGVFDIEQLNLRDLDGDGDLDVFAHTASSHPEERVGFLIGDGAGTFADAVSAPLRVFESAYGDMNGDGNLDIILVTEPSQNNTLEIHLGDGAGRFDLAFELPTERTFDSLAVGDLNHDGQLDLVGRTSRRVVTYLGQGGGVIAPFEVLEVNSSGRPRNPDASIVLADFNGDDNLDLVVGRSFGVRVFEGTPEGRFSRFQDLFPETPRLLAVDVDQDGRTDLCAANNDVHVMYNRTFEPEFCRRGNVNAAAGIRTDVLRVNGSIGDLRTRTVRLGAGDPFELSLAGPPARPAGRSPYVIYVQLGVPTSNDVVALGDGAGHITIALPFLGGSPDRIANTLDPDLVDRLGETRWPVAIDLAPTVLLSSARGVPGPLTLSVQGLIIDRGSVQGRIAVTNGILVEIGPPPPR